jgi:hypothetical protein
LRGEKERDVKRRETSGASSAPIEPVPIDLCRQANRNYPARGKMVTAFIIRVLTEP